MTCYPSLDEAQAAAKAEFPQGIDLVDVFRASEHVPAIVDDVIRLGIPYLWLQDEVIHDEAVARAQRGRREMRAERLHLPRACADCLGIVKGCASRSRESSIFWRLTFCVSASN